MNGKQDGDSVAGGSRSRSQVSWRGVAEGNM